MAEKRAERARALYQQAWARHQADRHGEALELAEQAIAIDPDCPNAHNLAGWLLFKHLRGRPDALRQAIVHFEEARRRFADDPVPLCNLADALVAAGAADQAIARMTEAAADERSGATLASRASNWLGWYQLHHGAGAAAALPLLERSIARAGWWATSRQNHGLALEATGDFDGARAAYLRALEIGDPPDVPLVLSRLGAIDREQRRPRRALAWFRRALHVERGKQGARAGEIAAACAALEATLLTAGVPFPLAELEERWIERDLEHGALAHGIDVRAGTHVDAERLAHVRRVERDEPDPSLGPRAAIAALITAGRHDDALAALAERGRTDPDFLLDHAFLTERAGDDARIDGDRALADRYYAVAEDAYAWYASCASSGGEGLARMLDVDRLRAKRRP